eukprot:m.176683 g.176683  ORF g.176683 m.176683 type:complete len:83 (-) comp14631_c2_seq2:499-747(-)
MSMHTSNLNLDTTAIISAMHTLTHMHSKLQAHLAWRRGDKPGVRQMEEGHLCMCVHVFSVPGPVAVEQTVVEDPVWFPSVSF